MSYFERLYLPRPDVRRLRNNIPIQVVANVVIEGYRCKGIDSGNGNLLQQAITLTMAYESGIVGLLTAKDLVWSLEEWPVSGLRMTGMSPALVELLQSSHKQFGIFAKLLEERRELIDNDLGFRLDQIRDRLPLIGLRGRVRNHIFDGHHRVTLGEWNGRNKWSVLTSYHR